MDLLTVLAQTTSTAPHTDYGTRYVLEALDTIWQHTTALDWFSAVLAIGFGVIPLMYGWRIYKVLTVIGAGLLGLFLGKYLGAQFDKVILGSIFGAALLAVIALPLMRWAVCVLGAVAGGVLAAGVWHAIMLPEQFVWAGALIGVVAGGMISFVVFKLSVMLFTSFAGASLIVTGVFSLIYQFETFIQNPPTTHLNHLYYANHWFLPFVITGVTLIGVITQYRFVRGSKDWAI